MNEPAWKRLASRNFLPNEVIALIQTILMSEGEVKMAGNLCGDDAQTFIDVIHEVLSPVSHFPRHDLITSVHLASLFSDSHLP